jgi:hypothetical protein
MTVPTAVADGIEALRDVADVQAVALVGSRARGTNRPDSDVDLILLTDDPGRLLDRDDWYAAFDPGAQLIRSERFGAISERRLRLADGLVVEIGIATRAWASTDPVDTGTADVVGDGLIPLFDPTGVFGRLLDQFGEPVMRERR